MSAMVSDFKYAVRTLLRAPGFTFVVMATLALGIGANTAIFSVVDAVLLERLPYPESERLVTVWQDLSRAGGPVREWFGYTSFEDIRDEPGLFEAVGAWDRWDPVLTGVDDPTVVRAATVSSGMFADVLRVRPAVGRPLFSEDDVEGAPGSVLLSHGLWQDRFGGAADIVGRSVVLDDVPYTVVGVLPEGFRPPFRPDAKLWRALGQSGLQECSRNCFAIHVLGRLAPGVGLDQARAHASTLAYRLEEQFPDTNANRSIAIFDLREDMTRDAAKALWILLGSVGFVLLIACTNVANLLLVRGASRQGEMAVRVALGAGKGPIFRQVLTESLVLAVGGGLAGLALAAWGTDALLSLTPSGAVPRLSQVTLNGRILAFTAALTAATGVLFGLVPAWRASGHDIRSGLLSAGRNSGGGLGVRRTFVVTQIAMALILLVGAGLLLRSFQRLNSAELGFETEGVLAFSLALPQERYPTDVERWMFYQRLLEDVRELPEVTTAGAVNSLPLAGNDGDALLRIEGEAPPGPGEQQNAWIRPVTEGYFETVGLDLTSGRAFNDGDDAGAPRVVIVNETLEKRYFPAGDAVGRRIGFGSSDDPSWMTIVGVAKDVRQFGIRNPSRPAVYFPYRQVSMPGMSVVLKSESEPESLVPLVRQAISNVDPSLAASSVRPLRDVVDASLVLDRFITGLLSLFALASLLLATVGIYGVVSFGVTRRMREMGIRLALGADGGRVVRLVVRGAVVMAVTGVGIGLAGSLFVNRVLGDLLYEVSASDPLTFVVTASLLAGVTVLAAWLPARRAAKADPVSVLRQE